MKYLIKAVCHWDDSLFELVDIDGKSYKVDILVDAEVKPPKCALKTNDSFLTWKKSLVGKFIEIESLVPYEYFTSGQIKITKK